MRFARLTVPDYLALVLVAAPLTAQAQTPGKVHRIAYVGNTPFPPQASANWDALVLGLRERGWIEGQNIIIEQRYTGGRPERFPELMATVVQIPVDAIVVADSQAAWAAKRATSTIPINWRASPTRSDKD